MKLSRKIFMISLALAILPLFFVAVHTTQQTLQILKDREVSNAETRARDAIDEFSTEINRLKNLVRVLAATRAAKLLPTLAPDDTGANLRLELTELFRTILKQNPAYVQVRLIGQRNFGQELVRVDQRNRQIDVTPQVNLQAKGARYYYNETIKLALGETYISHIDLNREFGKIETPLQPMIRVATPVASQDGENVGIIIINVNFHTLVGDEFGPDTLGDFLVTNASGDYLLHKDTERTFAFEFGKRERLQYDHDIQRDWLEWVSNSALQENKRFETEDHYLILSKIDIGFGTVNAVDRKWVYGFSIPKTAIEGIAERLDEHLYISLLAIAVFIAVASSYITSSVLKPLETLTGAANKIAQGDQDVKIDETGKGEVRILSDALQNMLHSLRGAAKTQELATLGRMAAMLAHDLRNSLSTVKMNIQILQSEDDNPELQGQWDIANEQILMMENVLADMLSFARPEQLQKDWHDPRKIAKTVCMVLEPHASLKNVKVVMDVDRQLPRLYCDKIKLLQALQNLLDNAIHFAPNGTSVRFGAEIMEGDEEAFIRFYVQDQGPGVSDKVKETLFDPFITNRPKGTGLGLAIVKRITDQHEGTIDVSSQKDKGATFKLSLPLAVGEHGVEYQI